MFDRLHHDAHPLRDRGGHGLLDDAGEARFRALLESAPDAIVVADETGRLVVVNARVEALFGYTREELLGQSVTVLVPQRYRAVHATHMARYFGAPTTRPMGMGLELRARRKDGSEFAAEISLSPLTLREGGLLVTAVIRDVSERRALEVERSARAAAEAASRAKDELLAAVSHELKTPLNAVLGWTALIRENPGNAKMLARALTAIENNTHVQRRLVDDLLDVVRISEGTLRVDMIPVDLPAVIRAAVDAVRPAAARNGVTLEAALGPGQVEVTGDPSRLQQVFGNLLMNGVKFSRTDGRVRVSLRVLGPEVEVAVEDDGQGIRADLLLHVFERFAQGHRAATPAGTGLGLGLAIVKDLVERHGGTIVAESEGEGRGACFRVRLPLKDRPEVARA